MPYFVWEFNPLYNFNITRDHNVKANGKRTTGDQTTSQTTTNGSISNTDLYSDTPQGDLYGITSKTYLTNARKIDNSENSSSSNTTNQSGNDVYDNTEDYLEHVSGYQGANASELLMKYRETFLNIDVQIIEELEVSEFVLSNDKTTIMSFTNKYTADILVVPETATRFIEDNMLDYS